MPKTEKKQILKKSTVDSMDNIIRLWFIVSLSIYAGTRAHYNVLYRILKT